MFKINNFLPVKKRSPKLNSVAAFLLVNACFGAHALEQKDPDQRKESTPGHRITEKSFTIRIVDLQYV